MAAAYLFAVSAACRFRCGITRPRRRIVRRILRRFNRRVFVVACRFIGSEKSARCEDARHLLYIAAAIKREIVHERHIRIGMVVPEIFAVIQPPDSNPPRRGNIKVPSLIRENQGGSPRSFFNFLQKNFSIADKCVAFD